MSRFVSQETVAVTEGPDTIYIKSRMDYGDTVRIGNAGQKDEHGNINFEALNTMLFQINILGWEGPGFEGQPYSLEALLRLEPNDPLLEKVLQEINARNLAATSVKDTASKNGYGGRGDTASVASPRPMATPAPTRHK